MSLAEVWKEVGRELRGAAKEEVREAGHAPVRFKVLGVTPLILDEIGGDLILEQGDEDFDIDERLLPGNHVDLPGGAQGTRNAGSLPAVGDIVLVSRARDGDYVATAVVKVGG
ncbi:MAG: hypothetical protein H0U41_05055 [Actinobacteria bacterium]|nr:hypothetical protein [Actinomycetota bacterium]